MKILLKESQIIRLLNEEYSEKIVKQLVDKFKQEQPDEEESTIRDYINRFDKIKNGPNITNKDITTYTYRDLESTVIDSIKNIKPKADKGDSNLDLKYSKDGLEIYRADTKDKCIKYGKGYSFCISAHGSGNQYENYRFKRNGTPYFVFNRNLEHGKDVDDADASTYLDPEHLLVIFVYSATSPENMPDGTDFEDYTMDEEGKNPFDGVDYLEFYSVTTANNRGESYYLYFDTIESWFPSLKGLDYIFRPAGITYKEERFIAIEEYGNAMLGGINVMNRRNMNDLCSSIEVRFDSYKELFDSSFSPKMKFLTAYKNKEYGTYTLIVPNVLDDETIEYSPKGKFVGSGAEVEIRHFMMDIIDDYKNKVKSSEEWAASGSEAGIEYVEKLKKMADLKNYKIKKCEWSNEFVEYLRQVNSLMNKLIYMKWKVQQEK